MLNENSVDNIAESASSPVASRLTVNYMVIAIAFLLIGIVIGNYLWNTGDDESVMLDEAQVRRILLSVLEESDIARARERCASKRNGQRGRRYRGRALRPG